MSYRNYYKPAREVLKRFEQYENLVSEASYSLSKASLKSNLNYHCYLVIESFPTSPANLERLNQLIESFESDLVLCEDLWVDSSSSQTTLIFIVPLPGRGEIEYLYTETCDKSQVFTEILKLVQQFHMQKIPYLELNPSKILYKGTKMYFFPFRVVPCFEICENYNAPEILAGNCEDGSYLACDIWALGCIFAEFFVSLTPLFEAVTPYERLLRMFEVLGVPEWKSVEKYLTWETYKSLKVLSTQCLKETLFKESPNTIFKMLDFNPDRRITANELQQVLSEKTRQLSDSKSSGKWSDAKKSSTELWGQGKEIDNFLNIQIHEILGLNIPGSNENLVICIGYELMLNTQVHAISDNYDAGMKVKMDFSQKFGINSEDFKSKYRHTPIIINVFKSIKCSARKSKEILLGSSEVYIGLLFSNASQNKNDNSVYGWYNIVNGNNVIGQILIEINTESPFGKAPFEPYCGNEEVVETNCESITEIKNSLAKLNTQLTNWGLESENKSKV